LQTPSRMNTDKQLIGSMKAKEKASASLAWKYMQ